jgi:hypothetical protein
MVKRNHVLPSEKGNGTASTNGSAAVPSASSNFPSFDEHTLSNLTRRIENGLRKSKENLHLGSMRGGRQDVATGLGPRHSTKECVSEGKIENRGKKRNRQGDIKINEHQGRGNKLKDRRIGKIGPKSLGDEDSRLLQEILLLGGTKEDLRLVADASSVSEAEAPGQSNGQENTSKPRKTLQRDVENFVKGLGISGTASIEDSSDTNLPKKEWAGTGEAPDGKITSSGVASLRVSLRGKLSSTLRPKDAFSIHNTTELV